MFELIDSRLKLLITSVPILAKNGRFRHFLDRVMIKQRIDFIELELRRI